MSKKTSEKKTEKKIDKRKLPRAERGKPTTGQSGSPLKLGYLDLNPNEQKVLSFLKKTDADCPIETIASGTKLTKLQVRNGLRRPVRAGFIKKSDRATYKVTGDGSKAIAANVSLKVKKEKAPKKAGKTAAKKTETKKAGKAEPTSTKELQKDGGNYIERASKLAPAGADKDTVDTAAVALAAMENPTAKDSTLAKLTGLKRGFVETRFKRLSPVRTAGNYSFNTLFTAAMGKPPKTSNGSNKQAQVSA